MNNKQQTAVEWLFEQMFDPFYPAEEQINWLEQAKEMEREQKCDFAHCYADNVKAGMNETPEYFLEEYEDYKN